MILFGQMRDPLSLWNNSQDIIYKDIERKYENREGDCSVDDVDNHGLLVIYFAKEAKNCVFFNSPELILSGITQKSIEY